MNRDTNINTHEYFDTKKSIVLNMNTYDKKSKSIVLNINTYEYL